MMLHELPIDVYRIAEYSKKCLSLLLEHPKKEELISVLIEAGESAWARGAHEVGTLQCMQILRLTIVLACNSFFRERPLVVERRSMDG